ncbi:MAG: hypothetical protein L0Y56_17730, partial [Nitrospira sp.]|nr:hypothetical protein [Nitrospira sp.]
ARFWIKATQLPGVGVYSNGVIPLLLRGHILFLSATVNYQVPSIRGKVKVESLRSAQNFWAISR